MSRNKLKLPRFKMPPPSKRHLDRKKEQSRKACRKFTLDE